MDDRAEEGRAYANVGIAYQSLSDFSKAFECHTHHLAIAKGVGDRAAPALEPAANTATAERTVTRVVGDVTGVVGDVTEVGRDVTEATCDVTGVVGDVTEVEGDVTEVAGDVTGVVGDVTEATGDGSYR